jgi:hypothetical protein
MEGKTHQILKAGVGWKSREEEMVPFGANKEKKGRKWCEKPSSEKRVRGSRGQEKMTPASTQDLRVNLERALAAHCFPGCKSGEPGVKPTHSFL